MVSTGKDRGWAVTVEMPAAGPALCQADVALTPCLRLETLTLLIEHGPMHHGLKPWSQDLNA